LGLAHLFVKVPPQRRRQSIRSKGAKS